MPPPPRPPLTPSHRQPQQHRTPPALSLEQSREAGTDAELPAIPSKNPPAQTVHSHIGHLLVTTTRRRGEGGPHPPPAPPDKGYHPPPRRPPLPRSGAGRSCERFRRVPSPWAPADPALRSISGPWRRGARPGGEPWGGEERRMGGGGSLCRPFGGLGGFWGPTWVLGGDFQGSPRSPCGSLGGCEFFGAFMGVLPGVLGPYRGAWRSLWLVKRVWGVRMGSWGSPCGSWGGLWGWVEGSRGVSGSLRWSVRDPGGQRGVAGGSQRWMKGSRGSQRGRGGGLGGGPHPSPEGIRCRVPLL